MRYRRAKSMGMGAPAPVDHGTPPQGEHAPPDSSQGSQVAPPRQRFQRRSRSMGLGAPDRQNGGAGPGFPPREARNKTKKKEDDDFLDVTYRKDWVGWSENMDRKIQRRFASGSAASLPTFGTDVRNSAITEDEEGGDNYDPYVTGGYTGTELVSSDDEPEYLS